MLYIFVSTIYGYHSFRLCIQFVCLPPLNFIEFLFTTIQLYSVVLDSSTRPCLLLYIGPLTLLTVSFHAPWLITFYYPSPPNWKHPLKLSFTAWTCIEREKIVILSLAKSLFFFSISEALVVSLSFLL